MGRRDAYSRVEERDHPGCIWSLLKSMISHKKHGTKPRSKTATDVGKPKVPDEATPVTVEWTNPPQTSSAAKNSKCRVSDFPEQAKHVGKTDSSCKDTSAEDVDILQIFKVNRQVFLKLLHDHDLARVEQSMKQNKSRLTKSGSFPNVSPSKLEDRHRENWPVLKEKDQEPITKSMPVLNENSQVTAPKAKFRSMRRATSLTESMDRYAHLYSSTFNKEVKRRMSRSLKLVTESDESVPRFRRRLSLPECEYESFLQNMEASREAVECGPIEGSAIECGPIEGSAILEVNAKENSFESAGESCEDVMNKALNEEINLTEQRHVAEVALDCDAQDTQCLISEDFPISGDYVTELQSKAENPETLKIDQILPVKMVDQEQPPEYHYVKAVLEASGFTRKEHSWVWYTLQQPLDTAVFEEIENHYFPFESQRKCLSETEERKWDRKLIFDLINEALMEIDERSCLYYPKALSFSCHVHLLPKGNQLVKEVWDFVGRLLSWRPELDPMLDIALAEDMHGRHGWMNLQLESECVGLELEDMILDELLSDEILLLACS